MTQVMKNKMRRRETSHSRRKIARRRTSISRRRMGKPTSLVIGPRTLIHQVAHSMMIVIIRRWPPL